jgi:hypothetical protein
MPERAVFRTFRRKESCKEILVEHVRHGKNLLLRIMDERFTTTNGFKTLQENADVPGISACFLLEKLEGDSITLLQH